MAGCIRKKRGMLSCRRRRIERLAALRGSSWHGLQSRHHRRARLNHARVSDFPPYLDPAAAAGRSPPAQQHPLFQDRVDVLEVLGAARRRSKAWSVAASAAAAAVAAADAGHYLADGGVVRAAASPAGSLQPGELLRKAASDHVETILGNGKRLVVVGLQRSIRICSFCRSLVRSSVPTF